MAALGLGTNGETTCAPVTPDIIQKALDSVEDPSQRVRLSIFKYG